MGDATTVESEFERILSRMKLRSDEELAAEDAKWRRNDRRDRLEQCGISERLDEDGVAAVLDEGERQKLTPALRLIRAWVLSSRPALAIFAGPGLGKTVAAAWALARYPGRYTRAQDMCEARMAARRDGRARGHYLSHLRCELLVVDELGMERDPIEALDTLHDVIDNRQRLPRRTLLLGNLDRPKFTARYDGRTLDRLGIESDHSGIAIIRFFDEEPKLKAAQSMRRREEPRAAR